MPRTRPILAEDLPNFFDFSPDDPKPRCISLAPSQGRRCKFSVSYSSEVGILRSRILLNPTDEDLGRYVTLCCCDRRYATQPSHRSKVSDPYLLNEIIQRYKRELAYFRNSSSTEGHGARGSASTAQVLTPISTGSIEQTTQNCRHRETSRQREPLVPAIGQTQTVQDTSTPATIPPRIEATRITRRTTANAERANNISPPSPGPFVPYKSKTSKSILDTLLSPLTPRDQQSGSIYCFSRVSNPNYYKVGCTTITVISRQAALQKCSGANNHVSSEYHVTTPNAFRVERLIQLELSEHRRRETRCLSYPSCVKRHHEWFEADLQVIKRTIYRWAKWMSEEKPYDEEGRLKEAWRDRVRRERDVTREMLVAMIQLTDVEVEHSEDGRVEHEECPICLETMENPATTVCGHNFCNGCIAEVFQTQGRCPLCRADLVRGS